MTQVYLIHTRTWADVIDECDEFIMAVDADGVNCYVIKDGTQQTRNEE